MEILARLSLRFILQIPLIPTLHTPPSLQVVVDTNVIKSYISLKNTTSLASKLTHVVTLDSQCQWALTLEVSKTSLSQFKLSYTRIMHDDITTRNWLLTFQNVLDWDTDSSIWKWIYYSKSMWNKGRKDINLASWRCNLQKKKQKNSNKATRKRK